MTHQEFDSEEFKASVQKRRIARMNSVDALPADVRALVHEYGLNVVNAFLQCKVTDPRRIKHLCETVLDEFSPTRGSFSSQGIRTPYIGKPKDEKP